MVVALRLTTAEAVRKLLVGVAAVPVADTVIAVATAWRVRLITLNVRQDDDVATKSYDPSHELLHLIMVPIKVVDLILRVGLVLSLAQMEDLDDGHVGVWAATTCNFIYFNFSPGADFKVRSKVYTRCEQPSMRSAKRSLPP